MSAIMAMIFGVASRSTTATQIPGSQEGSGALWVWGINSFGRLGLSDTINRSSPVQLGALTNWSKISSSSSAVLATKTDGTLWTWGVNTSGSLGLNNLTNRNSPVQVGTDTNWKNVFNEAAVSFATKTDGTLWVWGSDTNGNLGLNDRSIDRSSPVQVGLNTNWNIIVPTSGVTAAIKTDGTLWTWGSGNNLGLNTTTSRSSPAQVGGESWLDVSLSSSQNFAAIRSDGTLWTCGSSYFGQLGNNTRFPDQSSPVQVGTNTNWSKVKLIPQGALATKTDGTLWVWGFVGQLGINIGGARRSSPTQVGTDTNWSLNNVKISNTGTSSSSIKTDGTLWLWGDNSYGQLGLNDRSDKSSPVQVGTDSNWAYINSGFISSGIKRI